MSTDTAPCCTDDPTGDAVDPAEHRHNDPGQPTLQTRRGVHGEFKARMLAALSTTITPPDGDPATAPRPLRSLTTRADDDPTIGLIDAWAVALDVLAFYQERIQNEQYLGTATWRDSVVRIARMIGYEPRPGVAASTRLALTIDTAGAAPDLVQIDAGLAVMSVPGQDELPQTFETVEAVEASATWNAMAARTSRPLTLTAGDTQLWLAGVGSRLEPGQRLLVAEEARRSSVSAPTKLVTVTKVETFPTEDRSRITFTPALGNGGGGSTWTDPVVVAFRGTAGLFGWNAPDYRALNAELKGAFETDSSVLEGKAKMIAVSPINELSDISVMAYPLPWFDTDPEWPDITKGLTDGMDLDLDRETDKAPPGSWVAMLSGGTVRIGLVQGSQVVSRVDYTLTARVTSLAIDQDDVSVLGIRSTQVLLQSEELPLAEAPWEDPVEGLTLELSDGTVGDAPVAMEPGRVLLVEGEEVDSGEISVQEVVLADVDDSDPDHTVLVFEEAIDPALVRDSVVIYGNTALATHGRGMTQEVLGSGDATVPNPRYALRQAPLTWVAASNARGAESTLQLRVGGVLWHRVDSLYDAGPTDRVYLLELQEDGTTHVVFGDGVRGARVPTGTDNIVVDYRVDMGLLGEVDRGQLTLLQSRPLGLKGVTNPDDARGAADAESIEDARTSAPLTVMTLDRLVSLSDYEDFARAFAGIGKARASRLWDGRRAFVHLTVASASGEVLDTTDDTMVSLQEAITAARDPAHVVRIDPHVEVLFGLSLRLAVHPDHVRADVEEAVLAALVDAFDFDRRAFGQAVSASEVATIVHGVDGVVAVDVDAIVDIDAGVSHLTLLSAPLARWTGGDTTAATLLVLDADHVQLSGMDA